ncbi:Putative zn(2)Cys(6) fungal-type DNA-binding domain-containing protein [Colletotrichum destructivum]|uniref:Zn(2)Cys(6) fungal-type DNA-binding domain-containing protein n=1 Tax=Colletotrichum destructivum TaxID=34406 RepID=A0AAX4J1D0_9PEZI|nr:Putative zn(2)Cys(6) fungal-type DNA-binding domain-containing protein [Colletotrichum destructivum]
MSNTVKFRPLLPLVAAANGPPPTAPVVTRPPMRKRSHVSAACNGCRKRKVKCDGVRPSCYTCMTSNSPCVYLVPEGLSQRQAQKQKLDYVSRAHENSQRVLELLRASRDGASHDILKQLQHSEHLDEAVQSIADASLLLPKSHEKRREFSSKSKTRQTGNAAVEQSLTHDSSKRDTSAGNSEPDHVLPVSRWTTVSRDNKLLTHLLDMFWMWDSTLSHLADQELFIADLSATLPDLSTGQPRSFCSPFLVNAILAVASLHATRKSFNPHSGDFVALGHEFARCAFDLLESERRSDSSSLTLLQGAAILWLFANNKGARASPTQAASLGGVVQRTWSKLGLETGGPMTFRVSGTSEAQNVKIWKAVSHMTWGFYCFFAEMAALFSPDMLVPRPQIMKVFEDVEAQQGLCSPASFRSTSNDSLDSQTSHQLQLFSAKCSLCEISNQFMSGFSMNEQASLLDSRQSSHVTSLLSDTESKKARKKERKETLSGSFQLTAFPTRATYDFVALRLLHSYTSHAGTDLFDGRNAASLLVLHASSMMTSFWIYRSIYTIKHEYLAAEYCSFVAHALLPSLETNASTPVVHDIVGMACCVLNDMACAGVSGRAGELLEGIEERARAARIRVPAYGRQEANLEAHGGPPMVMLRGVGVSTAPRAGCRTAVTT